MILGRSQTSVLLTKASTEGDCLLKTHARNQSRAQTEAAPQRGPLTHHTGVKQAAPSSSLAGPEGGAVQRGALTPNGFTQDLSRIPTHSKVAASPPVRPPLKIQRREREQDEACEYGEELPAQLVGLQLKSLDVSDPNDAEEKEADEVARRVVEGRTAEVHGSAHAFNRKVSAKVGGAGDVLSKLDGGGGRSLDGRTRAEMESKMGADFSRVKVHTGSHAHALSEGLGARAFTHGRDIYFARGEFDPSSRRGKELLAHELAHTLQQRGGYGEKVRRKGKGGFDDEGKEKPPRRKKDISKQVENILAPSIEGKLPGGSVSVEAKILWQFVLSERTMKEIDDDYKLVTAESKLATEKHFYTLAVDGFKAKFSPKDKTEVKKNTTGLKFVSEFGVEIFNVVLKGGKPDFTLFNMGFTSGFEINGYTIENQPEVSKWLGASVVELIKARKMSISINLEVTASIGPSGYYKKRRDGTKAKADSEKHTKNKDEFKKKAEESKVKKNEAKAKSDKLKNNLKQKRDEIERLGKDKSLTPEQAKQKIEALEKEVEQMKPEAEKFEEAWRKEKAAMDDALKSANAEEKAAKEAARDARRLKQESKLMKKSAGRVRKALYKLEKKIAKQQRKVEKLVTRLAERAARWIEEKAAKRLGTRLALQAAKLVAKLVLRMIPIINTILFLWDVATLLYDLGKIFWNWFWGKEEEGEGEGTDEGGKDSEPSDTEGTSDTVEDGVEGNMQDGGGDRKDGDKGDEKDGGGKKDEKGVPDGGGDKDDKGKGTLPPDGNVMHDKDNPPPLADQTEKPEEEQPHETGVVLPWSRPLPGASTLGVSYRVAKQVSGTLVKGNLYTFKLILYYKNEGGKLVTVQTDAEQTFMYVNDVGGVPRFIVESPFVIQTDSRRIFFARDFPVKVHGAGKGTPIDAPLKKPQQFK